MSKYTADDFDEVNEDTGDDDEQTSSREDSRNYAIDHDVLELKERNAKLEQRLAAQEWRELAAKKQAVSQNYDYLDRAEKESEERLAMAIAEANGDNASSALRVRDEARAKKQELRQTYHELEQIERQAAAQPAKPPIDVKVKNLAEQWVKKNKWYDVNGRDEDSRTVLEIDTRLAQEGYVPRTELYWKELDRRVARNLPHRFKNSDASDKATSKKEIYISKERKEALISAGVWDDPVLRTKYVRQYQKWDKENNL